MPRQSNGTYVLPNNPVVPGTAIEADWANTTMNDIATALTGSLSRNAQGGMLQPLLFDNGTVAAPGMAFRDESNSGMLRAALGDIQIAVEGVPAMRFNNNASSVRQKHQDMFQTLQPPGQARYCKTMAHGFLMRVAALVRLWTTPPLSWEITLMVAVIT
jgi:hypothetical protein